MVAAKKETPKEPSPVIKVFPLGSLEETKLPMKVDQDLLIRTSSNILIQPFQHAKLSTGIRLEIPEGYRAVTRSIFGSLRVSQSIHDNAAPKREVYIAVQNTSPHVMDVSPGDTVAALSLIRNQDFDLVIEE